MVILFRRNGSGRDDRKNGKVFFTAEDKQNVNIKNFTTEESKQNLKKYARKSRGRRSVFVIALIVSLFFAVYCNVDSYSFFAYIVVILLAVGCLLSESIYWLNRKNVTCNSYIEIVVDQKKNVEICY